MAEEQFSPNGWPVDAEFLHIFAQGSNHDEAFIVGSREGLSLLRAAIDAALAGPPLTAAASVLTNDGEGYSAVVVLADFQEIDALALPYTEEGSVDGPDALWPHKLPTYGWWAKAGRPAVSLKAMTQGGSAE